MGLFDAPEPIGVEIKGHELHCVICRHNRFRRRKAQLNKASSSLLGTEWLDASAICYECDSCGYVHWFVPR